MILAILTIVKTLTFCLHQGKGFMFEGSYAFAIVFSDHILKNVEKMKLKPAQQP